MFQIKRPAIAGMALCLCGWAFSAVAQDAQPPQQAQPAQEAGVNAMIRELVEQLRADASAVPAGPNLEGVSVNEGMARFYEQRGYAPAWTAPPQRAALVTELKGLTADGLNPADYDTVRIEKGPVAADDAGLATYDVAATRSYILALGHLFRGKVDPASLDAQWNFDARSMSPDEALGYMLKAVDNGDIAHVFERARPEHPAYKRLRDVLARMRDTARHGGWPRVPGGDRLERGMDDKRVIALRKRLAATGELAAEDNNGSSVLDEKVEAAVKLFQARQYVDADGAVGPGTLSLLNVPVQTRIGQVRANLERARWLLHELHDDYILVDIAGFEALYYRNPQEPIWRARVQVGKPFRKTPSFKSEISYLRLNPTWTVPPTVLKEDLLPRLRVDRNYLAPRHIRVYDENGQEVDAKKINWKKPPGNLVLRQDAGPDNSLGRALLRFPNPYSVYLHDTPHRELFSETRRAFSSGCIRVEHIEELVRVVLREQGWAPESIDQALADAGTRTIDLEHKVPVLLGYWTIDIPGDGSFGFKPDIYERDPPLLKALDQKP